jgi:hypothetical protein
MLSKRKFLVFGLVIAGLLAQSGCTNTQAPAKPPPKIIKVEKTTDGFGPLAGADDCADQLQDLCGAMARFYQAHHHFPAQVQELAPYAFPGMTLHFTCPVSGKPYVCSPTGLHAPGESIRIYIYDAEPSHAGQRWCGYTKTDEVSGADAVLWCDHFPELRFQKFLQATFPPASPSP